MTITVEHRNGITYARLVGTLTAADADTVKNALADAAFAEQSRVVVDLHQLDNLDSSGLSVLIHIVTRSRMTEGRVVFVGPTPFVAGIFTVTRLDRYFEIYPTLDQAEAAMKQ